MPKLVIHTCVACRGAMAGKRLRQLSNEARAEGIAHTRTADGLHFFAALPDSEQSEEIILGYHRSLANRLERSGIEFSMLTHFHRAPEALPFVS